MKVIVKCKECGTEWIIKIPFRLKNKIIKIELICCNGKKTVVRYIDKIKLKKILQFTIKE